MREGGEKVSESGEKGLFLADLFNVEQLSAKDTFENVKRKEKLENTFSPFFPPKKSTELQPGKEPIVLLRALPRNHNDLRFCYCLTIPAARPISTSTRSRGAKSSVEL